MLPLVYTEHATRRYITFANDCGVSDAARRGHTYEPHVLEYARTLPLEGSLVFDIGANFGYHSIEFSEMVGVSGVVISFEPQTMVANQLRTNLFLNNITNVIIQPIALGNKDAWVDLELPDYASANTINIGNTHTDAFLQHGKEKVRMSPLDKLPISLTSSRVSLMKIDVQGYELEVLSGAEQTIMKHRPTILIEVEEPQLSIYGKTPTDIFEWFSAHQYNIRKVKDAPHLVDYVATPI